MVLIEEEGRHLFDVAAEEENHFLVAGLYQVNEHFQKAEQSSRMLCLEDLLDETQRFVQCELELVQHLLFRKHSCGKAIRVEIVAACVVPLAAIRSEEGSIKVECHISTGRFEIHVDVIKKTLKS